MLSQQLTYFASTAASESDEGLLGVLGIDWQMLLFQMIGFAILVALMAKFIYPVLIRIVDERQAKIDESLKAAREVEDNASASEERIEKQLAQARRQAKDIVTTAKEEATAMLGAADEKSKSHAEHLVETARTEIEKEVAKAKKSLHDETINLVAEATKNVLGKSLDGKTDAAVIKSALEEARK